MRQVVLEAADQARASCILSEVSSCQEHCYLVTHWAEMAPAVPIMAAFTPAVQLPGIGYLKIVKGTATACTLCYALLPDMPSAALLKDFTVTDRWRVEVKYC